MPKTPLSPDFSGGYSTTPDIAHPWSHPPFANYERILYSLLVKVFSGCVPKVCWNNLRMSTPLLALSPETFPQKGHRVKTRPDCNGSSWKKNRMKTALKGFFFFSVETWSWLEKTYNAPNGRSPPGILKNASLWVTLECKITKSWLLFSI